MCHPVSTQQHPFLNWSPFASFASFSYISSSNVRASPQVFFYDVPPSPFPPPDPPPFPASPLHGLCTSWLAGSHSSPSDRVSHTPVHLTHPPRKTAFNIQTFCQFSLNLFLLLDDFSQHGLNILKGCRCSWTISISDCQTANQECQIPRKVDREINPLFTRNSPLSIQDPIIIVICIKSKEGVNDRRHRKTKNSSHNFPNCSF